MNVGRCRWNLAERHPSAVHFHCKKNNQVEISDGIKRNLIRRIIKPLRINRWRQCMAGNVILTECRMLRLGKCWKFYVPSHLGRHGDSTITTGSVDYKIGPGQVHPAQSKAPRSLPPSAASEKSAAMVLSSFVGDFKMIYQENLDQLLEALGKHRQPVSRINEKM